MDRLQSELLVKTEPYIQNNLTVAEFLAKLEPMIPGDASRRLRILVENYLDYPMNDGGVEFEIPAPRDPDDEF